MTNVKCVSKCARAFVSVLAAVGCFAAATGCYSYLEVPAGTVAAGTRVRAHLSTEGVLRLEQILGGPEREVEGEVVQADALSLLLLARTGIVPMSTGTYLERQRIVIEQREILRVEQRLLERGRTYAAAAVVGAALVGTAVWLFTARSSGRDPLQPDEGPENALVPRLIR